MGRLLKLAKLAGKVSGVLGTDDAGVPVRRRTIRLAATALIGALLVWAGVDPDVAAAVGDLLAALLAE